MLRGLIPASGLDFVATYLDDVLIFSLSFEEHLIHLRRVLDRLIEVSLKLKPAKCHFICQTVEYLGHIITLEEIPPHSQKLAAVRDYPVPMSVMEVHQFFGFTSYYCFFVHGFAKVAEPLRALTQKRANFDCNSDCQIAFDSLKCSLTKAPILVYPNFQKNFVLKTCQCERLGSSSLAAAR